MIISIFDWQVLHLNCHFSLESLLYECRTVSPSKVGEYHMIFEDESQLSLNGEESESIEGNLEANGWKHLDETVYTHSVNPP